MIRYDWSTNLMYILQCSRNYNSKTWPQMFIVNKKNHWVFSWFSISTFLVVVSHCRGIYGQLKDPPLRSISLIRVSIGVFPTNRTKKSCSITCELTVRSDGNRRRSFPNRVGWLGYWLLTYSSSAHCDFSWILSTWFMSVSPQVSKI